MVSVMRVLSRFTAALARHRVVAVQGVAVAAVAALVVVAPSAPIAAAGLLDQWWSDIVGDHPAAAKTPDEPPSPARAAGAAPTATAQNQTSQAPAPTVPVALPKLQEVSGSLVLTGNAAAVNQVKLIARVVGYLEQIHFEDGALVRKGDPLFSIQPDQYEAQLQQAKAQLQLQKAALVYARTEVRRYTELLHRDAATQVDVDHWNFQAQSAEANILAAQAQVTLAQLNLSYTEVAAPFDGQMGKHLIDPGNVVGGNGQQAALAEITQLDPIYVVANLSSQQAYQIRANLDNRRLTLAQLHQVPVEVGLANESGFPHRGTLEYVAPSVDPATGTLLVRGILRNPDRTLLPGAFVNVRLPNGLAAHNALLVPDAALQEDQGGRYLLVVAPDGVVQQRYVQLGELVGSLRVIAGGLKPDDHVVVGELWRATPGTHVATRMTTLQ